MTPFKRVALCAAIVAAILAASVTGASAQVSCAGVPAWAPNVAYAAKALATYGGHLYSCLQAHTSELGWEPPNVPALWSDQGACGAGATATATATTVRPTATATVTTARATATATTRPTATSTPRPTATAAGANLALNRPATSSSTETSAFPAASAVDGNTGTRWSSAFSDPQWITIDLGVSVSISRVRLNWEAAYATAYQVQLSNDNSSWTAIKSVTAGDGGIDDWTGLAGSGRYLRIFGTTRATVYGYSLWEVEVYGTGGSTTPTPTATARATATVTARPTATATARPTPTATQTSSGGPTAAQLLAKMTTCNRIGGSYATDEGGTANISICSATGGIWWKADMDVDCDGVTTTQCNINTDPAYQNDTSLHTSTGQPFNAATMPFVVIPSISSRWSYANSTIQLGAVVAVVYNGQVAYGVFADTGPVEIIGESSYAMASSLGIDPDPSTGGTDSGVTYLVFPGSHVSPVESHAAAVSLGQQLATQFVNSN